jgi:ribulose-phosphate 3-epimerase
LRAESAGADALHLDIMDGHFVPNISLGPAVVAMADKTIQMSLNVHLMLSRPDKYIERFVNAGADTIQIHIESECDASQTLAAIHDCGIRAGLVVNPETDAKEVLPLLPEVDEVLCMTVHPGYGGQSFMPGPLKSIRTIRDELRRIGRPELTIMVDGGINNETAVRCAEQGANAFVAGTFLFGAADMAAEIRRMRDAASAALANS